MDANEPIWSDEQFDIVLARVLRAGVLLSQPSSLSEA